MRILLAAAVVVSVLAASSAFAQERATLPLSTSVQRTCPAEVTVTPASGQPSIEASIRTFRAETRPGGYELIQGAQQLSGNVELRVIVDQQGQVQSADLIGPGIDAMRAANPTVDVRGIAMTTARDIPERMVMNRAFAVGDQYYPPGLGEQVVSDLTSAFGLPFPVTGSLDIPLRSIAANSQGARLLTFEGTMVLGGSGVVQGANFALEGRYVVRIVHDTETGLVRESLLDGVVTLVRDGTRIMETRAVERYSCNLTPS